MLCSRVRMWARDTAVELQERYGFTAVDAAFVVHDAMYASPLHNLFAETQEAMMIVSLCVLWFVMSVPVCDVVGGCCGECDVVAGDVSRVPCICCGCCCCCRC